MQRVGVPGGHLRETGVVVEVLGHEPGLTRHLTDQLAVLVDLKLCDLVGVVGDGLPEPDEELGPIGGTPPCPVALECLASAGNCAIDVSFRRIGHLRPDFAGRRVRDVYVRLRRGGGDEFVVDEQAVSPDATFSFEGSHQRLRHGKLSGFE